MSDPFDALTAQQLAEIDALAHDPKADFMMLPKSMVCALLARGNQVAPGIHSCVREFHEAMGCPIVETPSVPSSDRVRLRASLITEEYFETMAAMFGGGCPDLDEALNLVAATIESEPVSVNLTELADGLCDLDYVVEGTRLEFGIPGAAVLEEVHRSNMAKKDGPVRGDGKRLKPPGWTPPDVAGVLERYA